MDLSQFKVRSFIIGIIALGVLVIIISFAINQIFKAFVKPAAEKPVAIASTTPYPTNYPGATATPTIGATPRPGQSPTPAPTPTPAASATPAAGTTKGGIAMNPTTGSDDIEVKNPGISIDNVQSGDKVNSPLNVNGRANVSNSKVVVEVLNNAGNVVASNQVTGCVGYDACPFTTTLSFEKNTSGGWLHAYNPSDNGDRLYEVRIPIDF
ncbi:hypothetical protein HY024_04220 [Candidatus Curtissbacteria bacterium]|nr:hypothetical protein [Candidatus Curtissbacteria bacterium]